MMDKPTFYCSWSTLHGSYRLEIDESAIYDGERRVAKLDTGGGVENYSNDNWRAAIALGARIVGMLNANPDVKRQVFEIQGAMLRYGTAFKSGDQEAIRRASTEACALLDRLAAAAGAAQPAAGVAEERERCARIADDEARIREEAGKKHHEDSIARARCFAGARAAANVAKGIRSGEVVFHTHHQQDWKTNAD